MENGKQNVYPITIEDNGNYSITHLGITKREYFAGLAMQSFLSTGKGSNAEDWVRLADALLVELEKNNL
jgi:hypothetical protein